MQVVLVRHLFALLFSFLFAVYLIPIIIRAAKKIGFMDSPDGRLKHQHEPIPYLGGLAIFISFITTLGLCYPFENLMLWLLLGTTLLLCIGLIDDLKVLKPGQKFFGQFIAALCFLKGGFSLQTPFFSSFSNIFLSGFWMLSVINAFNLVDVMDGLCATLALIAALTFGIIAFVAGKYTTSVLLAAFIGSVAGFLVYNKPQAKIYLGDAGTLFIGGFLAAIPMLFHWDKSLFAGSLFFTGEHAVSFINYFIRPLLENFFIPAIILAVPLLEGLGLFVIRSYLGMPFYNGSPHHFSIYLQKKGWGRWQVLAFASIMSIFFSIMVMLFLYHVFSFKILLAFVTILVAFWIYIIFLR